MREVLHVTAAMGLAFVCLQMLVGSLGDLEQESIFINLARTYLGDSLAQQTLLALVGAAMTVAVQSSSASIIIFMGLAQSGSVTVPVAAALVLGANLGTTSTALILSVQAEQNGRRIAMAHFLTKLGGVFITLMLFPHFLTGVEWMTKTLLFTTEPEFLVAGVHSAFNVISILWWSLLSVPILKAVAWIYPTKESKNLGLSKGVRRLLSRNPERAFVESQEQFRQLELLVKSLYDHIFKVMNEGTNTLSVQSHRSRLTRNFEALRETVHDLLFIVARQHPQRESQVLRTISMLEIYSSLSRTCFAFHDHLERGFLAEKYEIPPEITRAIDEFRTLVDRLWLDVLLPDKAEQLDEIVLDGKTLEQVILGYNRTLGSGHQTYTT
ncbi:MAG: Na/Pi cotransporter family protein, partial [Candidatus Eremiobacteraeota bacterium]|nr:Na/Pi cotransporter family protein [Candidatus Eremiobacteraeota bacterium]